jgi:ABC-2 type transport system permease protein
MDTPVAPAANAMILPPRPRIYGAVNWLGLKTLVEREIWRFMKVSAQTLAAPVMSTLLFMAVFSLAMSGRTSGVAGVAYADFLAPGLMMMGIISNAFQNSSSSLIIAKVQGNAVDFLMPPLSAGELTVAFIAGAVARGLLVGFASALAAAPLAHVLPTHWWAVIYFSLTAALIFSAMGLIGGIWASKFDNLAAITNFIITPLTFLSGTFYSVERLPEPFRTFSQFNPVHYMIDGFRYGFIGAADLNLPISAAVTGAVAVALVAACWRLLASGWRLKS